MPTPTADVGEFVSAPVAHIPAPVADLEKAKQSSEHVEEIEDTNDREVIYDEGEDTSSPPTGLRRLLRRNPSREFIRDVAMENRKELDPVEVSKVERKLFWLIVPALAVDYAFYYVSVSPDLKARADGLDRQDHPLICGDLWYQEGS